MKVLLCPDRQPKSLFTKLGIVLLILIASPITSFSQEFFRLTAPELSEASRAAVTEDRLSIKDAQGVLTHYDRDAKWDSPDRKWIAYTSRKARQVIRWPSSNQGVMMIGLIDAKAQVEFRPSKMTIADADPRDIRHRDPVDPILSAQEDESDLSTQQITPMRLSWNGNRPQFLTLGQNSGLSMIHQPVGRNSDWTMVPVGNGMVRFQMQQGNQWLALGCHPKQRTPMAMPVSGTPGELWRWSGWPGGGGGYLLESVLYPGLALTFQGGNLFLQQIGFLPSQQWFPVDLNPIQFQPTYRSIRSETIPNPPLPPSQVELVNLHSEAIFILLADRRPQGTVQTIRIPAGQSEFVQLDRDAGSTVVEVHETLGWNGRWDRQEFEIAVPPSVFYDLSVYEEFLQSIAIDRTGKSPNPIEDINYQPKSVGWYIVPPGSALQEQERLDAFRMAKSAKNPGAVRRIDRELLEKKRVPSDDPLRSILKQFQGQRAAF